MSPANTTRARIHSINANRLGGWIMTSVVALVVAAGSSAALAQSAEAGTPQQEKKWNYQNRLGEKRAAAEGAVRSHRERQPATESNSKTYITSNTDGRSVSIVIENGEVTSVQVDGKDVPEDRVIKHPDGMLEIIGEDGESIYSAKIGDDDTDWNDEVWNFQPLARLGEIAPGQFGATRAINPPPVMLGITMSEPDEDVADLVGVEPGEVVRVDTIIEGLPASKGGLKVRDIIVAVDGTKPVSQEKLREILRTKKPGDEIALTVIRRGKKEDLSIKLEAYDAEALGNEVAGIQRFPQGAQSFFGPEQLQDFRQSLRRGWTEENKQLLDEAREALREALEEIRENEDLNPEKIKQQAIAALSQALDHVQAATESAKHNLRGWMTTIPAPAAPPEPPSPSARPQVYITPTPVTPDNSAHMQRMTDLLERMEQRMAELEAKLAEKERKDKGGR